MKGHQVLALREAGFPIDELLEGAWIPQPTRGAHDEWVTDYIHTAHCCRATQPRVVLADVAPERHTDYRLCAAAPTGASVEWSVVTDVAAEYSSQLELVTKRFAEARDILGRSNDTVDYLCEVGSALHNQLLLQYNVFRDLRRDVTPTSPSAREVIEGYLEQQDAQLRGLCEQFAPRWWACIAPGRPASRLTYFSTWTDDCPDVAASVAAGDLVVRGSSWFVVRTPRLTTQDWWNATDDAMHDLGPARADLPDGLWSTFGSLVDSDLPPQDAFAALVTATVDG